MVTLIIHAPKAQLGREDTLTFEQIVAARVGRGFAIPSAKAQRCHPGCRVILLCKDEGKRAEGILLKLTPREKTLSGMQRYDIYVHDFNVVPYKSERLGRTGVEVI